MKKLFIAVILAVAVGSSAFAMDVAKISYKVKNTFEAQFSGAENVQWTLRETYAKVCFTLAEENVEAFFGNDGELIGYSRKIELKKLPLKAIQKIKKDYAAYTVTDSIEFDQDGDKRYYVSLENGAKKEILEVSLYGTVTVFNIAKK